MRKEGNGPAGTFRIDRATLSSNATFAGAIANFDWGNSRTLGSGASFSETNTINLSVLHSGTYFLIFQTDVDGRIPEDNEENNNLLAVPVNVLGPDLVVSEGGVSGVAVSGDRKRVG